MSSLFTPSFHPKVQHVATWGRGSIKEVAAPCQTLVLIKGGISIRGKLFAFA